MYADNSAVIFRIKRRTKKRQRGMLSNCLGDELHRNNDKSFPSFDIRNRRGQCYCADIIDIEIS